jgi:hypothetical protein
MIFVATIVNVATAAAHALAFFRFFDCIPYGKYYKD